MPRPPRMFEQIKQLERRGRNFYAAGPKIKTTERDEIYAELTTFGKLEKNTRLKSTGGKL